MNIYVGNLAWKTKRKELKELFENFGVVINAFIVRDKKSRRSRGFGFVEMAEDDEARMAIEKLNNTVFLERTIVVNEARAKDDEYQDDEYQDDEPELDEEPIADPSVRASESNNDSPDAPDKTSNEKGKPQELKESTESAEPSSDSEVDKPDTTEDAHGSDLSEEEKELRNN